MSYDVGGERVATVNCPNCGVQRPVAIGVCPNCLMSTAPSGQRLTRGLVLAGVTVVVLMALGYLISRRTELQQPPAAAVADSQPAVVAMDTTTPPVVASPDTVSAPAPTVSAAPPAAAPTRLEPAAPTRSEATAAVPSARQPAPPPSVAVSDTGRWEFAIATTWVRVRSAPNRESEILRIVDSAQRVRLGPPQNGWRPIRVGVDRGWVDPRLFLVIPAPAPRP
ncbi:MAG: hypothetical protein FJ363_02295 [Gemmatimonadetes bacterium]|nr:hypothetical protein [Gemmatimonadota bacterium]